MEHALHTSQVSQLMQGFAQRTGLEDTSAPPRRYLWTDAFAVCNFLGLFRAAGERRFLDAALGLVDQVHRTLGRHRPDDPRRSGWISGLGEEEGARHPTQGGLRIGKEMDERGAGEPFDERQEWDRDGQYYHYLTKWMHALDRVARVTGEARYHQWALELAQAAHAGFAHPLLPGAPKRLYWKMSIDLSYPLVPSMGQHDPLDGWITYQQLRAGHGGAGASGSAALPDLDTETSELAEMCAGASWRTTDPLGIGGLLSEACRLAQLVACADLPESAWLARLLDDAESSLDAWARANPLRDQVDYRLAFRELGLSIGLHSLDVIRDMLGRYPDKFPNCRALESRLSGLARFRSWRETIELFWLAPDAQQSNSWRAHREINSVMLATSLCPDGYLVLDGEPSRPVAP